MISISSEIISVKDLKTYFFTREGVVKAVDDISFNLDKGEILGLVGESGCGKTTACLSIIKLVPFPGKIIGGKIFLSENKNLINLNEKEMQRIRGKEISIILQNPLASLNPVYTIRQQLVSYIIKHKKITKFKAEKEARDIIDLVGISKEKLNCYPYECSGGMCQRICIAVALLGKPKLLIADEPTTALDVTIQAQILKLIKDLSKKLSTSVILITHDLGIIAEICDKVAVMYAGQIVEYSDVFEFFTNALHPYSLGLLNSIPKINEDQKRLKQINGKVPDLLNLGPGCRFFSRCNVRKKECFSTIPKLVKVSKQHLVRCHLY